MINLSPSILLFYMNSHKKFTLKDLYLIVEEAFGLFGYYESLAHILTNQFGQANEYYTLFDIETVLSSRKFIQSVHPYMNSLLTSTNIKIIKQTLRIYSALATKPLQNKALDRLKSTVNIFTMYQLEKNATGIECSLQIINEVFGKIGFLVSVQDFDEYYPLFNKKIEDNRDFDSEQRHQIEFIEIHDLLPLAIELQTTQEYKRQLLLWISSEEYDKKVRAKERKQEKEIRKNKQNIPRKGNLAFSLKSNNKKLERIHIKYMKSSELLKEIESKDFVIKKSGLALIFKNYRQNIQDQVKAEEQSFVQESQSNQSKFKSCFEMELGFKTGHSRKNTENSEQKKNLLNGINIRQQIKEQLQKNQAVIYEQFNPNQVVSTPKSSFNCSFLKEIANQISKPSFFERNKIMREPFFRVAENIFRKKK